MDLRKRSDDINPKPHKGDFAEPQASHKLGISESKHRDSLALLARAIGSHFSGNSHAVFNVGTRRGNSWIDGGVRR